MSAGFTSTIYVRFIHALVRRQLKSLAVGIVRFEIPLNQFDLAMTNWLLAVSFYSVLGFRYMATKQRQRVLHFWRYVGWLMGIDKNGLFSLNLRVGGYFTGCSLLIPRSDHSSIVLGLSLSKNLLRRKYLHLRSLQQKLAYRQHLELTQFLLVEKKMKLLGLPQQSASWFAYYLIVRNLLLYNGASFHQKLKSFI